MFFREMWLNEGNPVYIFAKDNNVWIISMEDDINNNKEVLDVIKEYTKNKDFSFVNIIYSTNFNVEQYILDEEKYKEEVEDEGY